MSDLLCKTDILISKYIKTQHKPLQIGNREFYLNLARPQKNTLIVLIGAYILDIIDDIINYKTYLYILNIMLVIIIIKKV